MGSILSHINPVYTITHHFLKYNFNIIPHLRQDISSGILTSDCPTMILQAFLVSFMHATCPTHLSVTDFIVIISGKYFKWSLFSSMDYTTWAISFQKQFSNIWWDLLVRDQPTARHPLYTVQHNIETRGHSSVPPATFRYATNCDSSRHTRSNARHRHSSLK
jgi:hypothetical protein